MTEKVKVPSIMIDEGGFMSPGQKKLANKLAKKTPAATTKKTSTKKK